jgi:fumarylpyruvate hydrolase
MPLVIPAPETVTVPVAAAVGGGQFPVRRVYCVGRNYAEHAQEMGFTGREPPFFFMKPGDAVVPVAEGETGAVEYPPVTENYQHEVELVVAIGRGGRNIAAADAKAHIWGYAVGLDMTRRDRQIEMRKEGRPWDIGKGFDASAPIGALIPADRSGPMTKGAITLHVNGAPRQKGDLADLIWSVPEIIEQISRAWTLAPGDLIYTGTPAGVGAVHRGDVLEAAVDGLPTLRLQIR